jgi:hypothetical protein
MVDGLLDALDGTPERLFLKDLGTDLDRFVPGAAKPRIHLPVEVGGTTMDATHRRRPSGRVATFEELDEAFFLFRGEYRVPRMGISSGALAVFHAHYPTSPTAAD